MLSVAVASVADVERMGRGMGDDPAEAPRLRQGHALHQAVTVVHVVDGEGAIGKDVLETGGGHRWRDRCGRIGTITRRRAARLAFPEQRPSTGVPRESAQRDAAVDRGATRAQAASTPTPCRRRRTTDAEEQQRQ